MYRRLSLSLVFAAATLAVAAHAHPRHPHSIEVLVGGVPLEALHARGKTYVEALEGREYAIRLTNQTGGRVAVALAVDGLNSIDARSTTADEASKWILGPYESVTIDGWQTGPSTARRFFFTTEDDSYGAWLGKTRNLGLISAAFFREKLPQAMPYDEGIPKRRASSKSGDGVPAAPEGDARAESEQLSDDHAATGMGREVGHHVRRAHFDAEARPASVVDLRYEYRDALISLGIVPGAPIPLHRRESAHGFETFAFAPAPR